MRLARLCVLLAACVATQAAPAAAATAEPRSAAAFRDSVGVSTHIVYYDTAYGDWPRVVDRLRELGVAHVRDGVYANPAPQWRAWNERYYHAVDLAAAHGIRFAFGMGRPGSPAGTIGQLLDVVGGRLRHAAAALEAPNEFDHFVGGPRWPARLAAYGRELYRKAKARRAVRSLPVVGPSLVAPGAALRLGDQRRWLDAGNIHPYTGGLSPGPPHLRSELARIGAVSGRKPVWATEAGFHNALRAREGQPPVSEAAGAVYLLLAQAGVHRTAQPARSGRSGDTTRPPAPAAPGDRPRGAGPAQPGAPAGGRPPPADPLADGAGLGPRGPPPAARPAAPGRRAPPRGAVGTHRRSAGHRDGRAAPPARRPRASASPAARSSWRSSPAARAADRARR